MYVQIVSMMTDTPRGSAPETT